MSFSAYNEVMRQWNLKDGDPLSLTLAADGRLSSLDYANDHIWELSMGKAEPAALLLQTSYGLRARNMRIFPQFQVGRQTISDPGEFDKPPSLHQFFPNYLLLSFSPISGLDVVMEYWAQSSQIIAGRIKLSNTGPQSLSFVLEMAALLSPIGEGFAMIPEQIESVNVLKGQTADLNPVLFFTGGAVGRTSPYPSLRHELDMQTGTARRFTWVLASLSNPEESFKVARQTATMQWDREIGKVARINDRQIDIETGNPDWDAAFALGQTAANQLLFSPNKHLKFTTFVSTRNPDQGFSNSGDGSDYNHLWNGQTALEAWYLSGLLLPGSSEIAAGLLNNFLSTQNENGRIDNKPGLAGQRSNMMSMPLLSSLAWKIYQHTEDKNFLEGVFSNLLDFVIAWFDEDQDRDGDGIPEWTNPIQSGFDDNPGFANWFQWAQGANIRFAESPDLCAYLYRECHSLIKCALELERPQATLALEAIGENLLNATEASWDPRSATYRYWDRDSHNSPKGETIKERKGPGEMLLDMVFELPARLLLRIESQDEMHFQAQASLHGSLSDGRHRVETIGRGEIEWTQGLGIATLENLYSDLDHIQIEGVPDESISSINIVDYRMQDHTLLTPLWAQIPSPERAEKIVRRKLLKPSQYGRPFGIPAVIKSPKDPGAEMVRCIWLPWNVMVAEGLLEYGYREEAADLLNRIMNAIIPNLKREHSFRKHYHADKPKSLGERNALLGLPPIGLFLDILGIRIISPWKVYIKSLNPFAWPVKLKYRGLTIETNRENATVTFPDGQVIQVDEAGLWITNHPIDL